MAEEETTRELLVFAEKTFKIRVPLESKITFAPFSPPSKVGGYDRQPGGALGTLRIYSEGNEKRIIAVFSGVKGFRDMGLDYEEEVAREEGAIIWNSDKDGYKREEKVTRNREWVRPEPAALLTETSDDDEEGVVF